MKDNVDRLLEAIEQPEQLSDEELEHLLEDSETRNLYHLMCKTADALSDTEAPDIDAEWQKLANDLSGPKVRRRWIFPPLPGRNAAAVIIGVIASLTVVAASVGIKYSLGRPKNPLSESRDAQHPTEVITDNVVKKDTVPTIDIAGQCAGTIVFKGETLDSILSAIGKYYDVSVTFKNSSKKELHLYFQWDRSLPLSDIVEQINSFEQINMKLTNNDLAIE